MKKIRLCAILSTLFLNALAYSKVSSFDVMDVAYLWPYKIKSDNSTSTYRLLPVYTKGFDDILSPNQKTQFLTLLKFISNDKETFEDVALLNPLLKKNENSSSVADSWENVIFGNEGVFMSAFRFEICGPGVSDSHGRQTFQFLKKEEEASPLLLSSVTKSCNPRLQIVAQHGVNDSAAHLIYSLPESYTEAMIDDLLELKRKSPIPTDGRPLGVHPGFVDSEKGVKFSNFVIKFVRKYVRSNFLKSIAFLSTDEFDGGNQWNFGEAEFYNNGQSFFMKPNLALQDTPISQGFGVTHSFHKTVVPFSLNATRWFNEEKGRDQYMPPKELIDSIEHNMNPLKASVQSIDCKSCHSSSGHINTLLRFPSVFGLRQNFNLFSDTQLFRDNSKIYYAPGVTGFPDSQYLATEGENFRAFGWFQYRPTVNSRVAMKSAAVASTINKKYFRIKNPSNDCGDKRGEVLTCMYLNAGSKSDCVQRFCN